MAPRFAALAMSLVGAAACSGFTADDECRPGETAPCETACGDGTMECGSDGSWGVCTPLEEPECLPGEMGSCELAPESPPGMWFCSDRCQPGPCLPVCFPGDTFECEAECGPGMARCQDDGTWSECVEYIIPDCRQGEVDRCPDGEGHRRCNEQCLFGPCDHGAPCTPGELSRCGLCASQVCLGDGTWSECAPNASAVCTPGEARACEAPCGVGEQVCTDECEWTGCNEVEAVPCHPGDRQMCPTTLYCGLAFRVCTPYCAWADCVEAGD